MCQAHIKKDLENWSLILPSSCSSSSERDRSNAGCIRLTYSQRFMCVFHGGPDDVGAMDAILMAKLLGLVEPLSCHVLQLAPVIHSLLQFPERTDKNIHHFIIHKYSVVYANEESKSIDSQRFFCQQ